MLGNAGATLGQTATLGQRDHGAAGDHKAAISRIHAVGLGSARVSRAAEPSRRRLLAAACWQTKRCGAVRESNGVRRDAEHGTRDARAPLNGIVPDQERRFPNRHCGDEATEDALVVPASCRSSRSRIYSDQPRMNTRGHESERRSLVRTGTGRNLQWVMLQPRAPVGRTRVAIRVYWCAFVVSRCREKSAREFRLQSRSNQRKTFATP